MANSSIITLGVVVLLSGLISLGWVVSAIVYGNDPRNIGRVMSTTSDPLSNVTQVIGSVSYSTSYAVASLSLGMSLVGIALIILGSSPSTMMGVRR